MFANPSIGIAPGRDAASIVGIASRGTSTPPSLPKSETVSSSVRVRSAHQESLSDIGEWSAEAFAQEQIKTLVRRVFFGPNGTPVKQVVFSAAGSNLDVADICRQVGHALAFETSSDISIVVRKRSEGPGNAPDVSASKNPSTRIERNLWQLAELGPTEGIETGAGRYWLSRLAELRSEFEYSVIEGPVAGISSEAALLAELADGIVLVLAAHRTRRASIRKIKDALQTGQSRILGTVLSGRTFPIPEGIYRRL